MSLFEVSLETLIPTLGRV